MLLQRELCLSYFSKLQRITGSTFKIKSFNVEVNKNQNKIIQMWFKTCIKEIEKLPYENFLLLDILDWFLSYREHDISSTIFRQSVGTRLSKLKSIDWTWLKKNRCGNWRDSQFDSLSRSYLGRKEIVTEITISVFDSRIYIAAFLHGH